MATIKQTIMAFKAVVNSSGGEEETSTYKVEGSSGKKWTLLTKYVKYIY